MSDQIPQLPVPSAEDAKKFKSSATSGGGTGGLNLPVPSASEIQKFKSTSAQKKNPIPTGGPSPSVVTKPSSVSNQQAKPTPSASSLAAPKPVSVIPGKSQGKLLMAQPKNTLGENALAIESQKRDVFSPSFGSVNVNKPRAAKAPQAPQAPQVPAPKKVGALEDIGNTFMSSVNRFAGGIVGIPNMSQKSALMMATKMHGIDDEYNSLSVTAKKELDNIMSATSTGAIPNANISREAQDYFIKKSNEFLDKTNKSDKFLNERIGDFFKAPSVEKATDLFLEIPKGFAESLPYMINPVLGAVSAASEQYNKDVQEAGGKLGWGQLVNAGVTGVSEYFIERISNGILNRSVAQAIGAPKVAKELAKGFVKSVLKDVGMEGAGEGLTEFVQSLSDDITKGKEINWVETANRTLDASIKGSGVAGGMRTTGAGVGYLAKKVMPKSDKNKVDRNTRAIMDLNTKKGPDNSPEVNSVIDSKIKELNDENKNIINSNIAKAKSLSDAQIQEVVKIDSDIQAIKNNRNAIVADPNLTDAEKQSLLDHLKSQAVTLTERKTAVENQQPLTEASFGQPDELGRITFEFGSEKEIPSELKGLTPTAKGSSTDEKGNKKIILSFSQEQINPIRDAIQKQTTSEVPIQPEAGTGLQVAEGEPQAEPQVPTQEGEIEKIKVKDTINDVPILKSSATDYETIFIPRKVFELTYKNDTANNSLRDNGEPMQTLDSIIRRGGYSVEELNSLLPNWKEITNEIRGVKPISQEEQAPTVGGMIQQAAGNIPSQQPTTATQEVKDEDVILSGLSNGFKAVTPNSFDPRSDEGVSEKVQGNKSFATTATIDGKKYAVVGLKLTQDVGAKTSGRDGYTFAAIEDNGNLPDNVVDILTQKAVANTTSVYPNITDATIDSFKPIEVSDVQVAQPATQEGKEKKVATTKKLSRQERKRANEIVDILDKADESEQDKTLTGVKYNDIFIGDESLGDILNENKLSTDEKRTIKEIFRRNIGYFNFDKADEQKFLEGSANPEDAQDVYEALSMLPIVESSQYSNYNKKNYDNVKDEIDYIVSNPEKYTPNVVGVITKIKDKLDNPKSPSTRLYAVDVNKMLGVQPTEDKNKLSKEEKDSLIKELDSITKVPTQEGQGQEVAPATQPTTEQPVEEPKQIEGKKLKEIYDNISDFDTKNHRLDLNTDGLSLRVSKENQNAFPVGELNIYKDDKLIGDLNFVYAKKWYEDRGVRFNPKESDQNRKLSEEINDKDVILSAGVTNAIRLFEKGDRKKGIGTKVYLGIAKYLKSDYFTRGKFKNARLISSPQYSQSADSYFLWDSLYKKGLAKIIGNTADTNTNISELTTPEDIEYLKAKGDKRQLFIGEDLGMAYEGKPNGAIYNGNIYALDLDNIVSEQPSTEQPTTEQPVEEPKQIKVADAESIEKQMQTTFGLNKTQSKAAAVVIDKIAGTIAKRAGTTKSKIMDAIAFKKGDINELSDQALFQKAERIKASKEDVDNAIKEVRSMGEKSPLGNETFMPNGTGVEIRNWEGSLWISSIYTLPEVRGKGAATETMIDILNIASKYNVPVRLEASPFGAQKGLTKNQLINWYKKLGFKNIGFGELQKAPSTISQEVLKEGKEIKIEPVAKVKATEKRKMPEGAKLVKPEYFFLDGEYDVVVNGKTIGNIYYDRASRTWNDPHFDRTQETPWSFKWMYGEILGENKEEAVNELIKRYKQFPEGVKFQKSNNIAKGAMQLASDGSAIIYALTDPDVSTPLHEMAHVYENYLTEDERKSVLDWAGKKDWDMPVSEKFARGFEKYLAEGKAPSKELTKIFESFKKWLLNIYNGIVGSEIDIKLNDDMRKIYDTMLTEGEEVGIKELSGYARMMGEVDGIIEKSMNRGVPFNKTMDNAINYMEKSKVYEDATDTQREAMVREVRNMFDKKEKKAPTAQKILGQKPTKTTITVDESKELNKRLKALEAAEETGRKIGYKEGLKESEQARKGILDYVKSLKVNNKISGSQFKAIVNALKANLLNPVIRKRVEERIDKIIKKANYADQLERSNKLRAAIKKASKSKTLAANIAIMAKKFAKVNPNNVENLDEYIDMANLVYNSIGKPMRTIAEEAMVNEYSEMKIKEAQEAKSAGLEDLFNSLVKQGLIPKNLSLAEVQQYVLEEEQNKKVEESEQREKEKRDVLDIVFNGLKDISNVMLNDGYNPFTGEDVTLSTEDRQLLKDFTSMDLSKLPISSGYRAQEALMNYIVNGRKFGMRGILARYQGAENVKVAVKKGLKAADFRWAVGGSWWGSRKWAKEVESIPGLFTWLFRGRTRGREVMKLMGLDEFMAGAAEAKIDRVSAENEYIAKFLNKKPNGKRFNNINNTYERLVYAYLSRSVDGSAEEKQAEFDRRKRILAQNVQAMEQSRNKDLIEEAQVLKRELNKAKDAKNADELNSKFDTINIQAVEFISGKFDEYFDKVDEVAEGIYNLILSKDDLYTPDMFRDISEKEINVAEMKESVDIPFDLLNKKPVGTMLENKRIPNLPGYDVKNNDASKVTKILKLDFDSSAFNALEKSLTDTYTAEAVQKYSAFVKSDEFYKLFDNVNDEKLFKEIVNYYINNERGKVGYKSDWKAVQNFSTRLKNFSTYRALGSATAFLKQSASAMINTSINLSNDPYALSQVTKAMLKDEAIGDFINRSRSEINLRGAEATADIKSAEKLIRESKYQGLTDALDTIDKLGRFQMKSLSFGDVPMARASWFGYYVHALKIQGKPYKNIDWSKAKLDKDAATYANTEVSINQNASMPSTLGQLFSSKNPLTRLTATYLFPFTSFLFNAKSRLKTDITVLTSKLSTPEDKQAAGRSIVATLAEMPAYIAISTSINYALVGAANAFLGYDEDEEDEKLRLKRYSELAVTRIITDLLSPAPNVGDVATVAAFNALLEKMQEDPDMEEEEKKDVFKLFESKPESMLSAMAELLLQPISSTGRRTMDIYNTIDMAVGDVYVTDSGKEIEFLDEEKKMLKIAAAIQIMGSLNLLPSEAESLAKKMVKTIEKSAKEDVN